VTVTTSSAIFLSKRKEPSILQPDPEHSQTCATDKAPLQADSRRSLTFAIAAAIPSTVLLLTPDALAAGPLRLAVHTAVFLFFQTVVYIGLSLHLFALPNRQPLKNPTNLLRSLSLNNMAVWTVVLMVCGLPTTPIDYWTISLVFARVLEWMAVISIVRATFHCRPYLC
jgi:hypothetical protein